MSGRCRVLVTPDSFKGSLSAAEVARAIAEGWRTVRPDDDLVLLPQADGGEGTADATRASVPEATWQCTPAPVSGPDGRPVNGRWLLLPDGTAVVELAQVCGLPMLAAPDPTGATTRGLGQVVRAALQAGARAVRVALGGSASTDGGAGALRGLGARLLDGEGRELPDGGAALADLARVDLGGLVPAPPGGVELLTDTTVPLTGVRGAAAVLGPQKGATPAQVTGLDRALGHFVRVLGTVFAADPALPGSGAAGGTAFGLAAWGGRIVDGAARIADMTGLSAVIGDCDVLVTGEGRYDDTSHTAKLVGSLLDRCTALTVGSVVVAGRLDRSPSGISLDLSELAGSTQAAMAAPQRWLRLAGARAALAARHVAPPDGAPAVLTRCSPG